MPFYQKNKHSFHIFFLLLLFGLFGVLSLSVTVLAARTYQQTTARLDKNCDFQELDTYFTEKLKQSDCRSPMLIYQKGDTCILIFNEGTKKHPKYTYFYQYADNLRELTLSSTKSFSLSDGKKLFPASNFSAEVVSEKLYKLTVWDLQQIPHEFFITLHVTANK